MAGGKWNASTIEIPAHLVEATKATADDLKQELTIRLHNQNRLSLDEASELAGISTEAFEQLLRRDAHSLQKREQKAYYFTVMLAAETRTPLNVIQGYVDLLKTDHSLTEDQRKFLAGITKMVKELYGIWEMAMEYSQKKRT